MTLPTLPIDPNFRIENKALPAAGAWHVGCAFPAQDTCGMLKITVVEDQRRRRVIVEGKLIAPWTAELASAYQTARTDLQGRELIVDLKSLTAISPQGEDILLQLIREKVKFLCGVYTKEVLRQLGLKARDNLR